MALVSGVCRTASAPMLSHGGSRLNASKPEASPKTRCPHHIGKENPGNTLRGLRVPNQDPTVTEGGLKETNTTSSNRQSKQRRLCRPRWRKVYHKITREPLSLSIVTSSEKTNLRPSPNERTRMGWHRRHAWDSFLGSRGTLRPETLNLEAWISCSGTH